MAVPTITSVFPDTGSTMGKNIVLIQGTNFKVPVHPVDPEEQGPAQKTVKVTFDDVECELADAFTDTLIRARVPIYAGSFDVTYPLSQDVRVANLDDSGVEIPGENATLADGYSRTQPDLVGQEYLQRVIREFVLLFQRHVLKGTFLTVERDYAEDPDSQETLTANLPSIHILGPTTRRNGLYECTKEPYEEDPVDPNAYFRNQRPVTRDLEFRIRGWVDNTNHLFSLGQAVEEMFNIVKWVEVDIDKDDPSKGSKQYELDILPDEPVDYDVDAALDDLRSFQARCVIRGVHIAPEAGTIIEKGYIIYANDGEPSVEV